MLNSEMIRINSLEKIVTPGHIVKIQASKKYPEDWKNTMEKVKSLIEESIADKEKSEMVRILHSNSFDRCNYQIPNCSEFSNTSSTMKFFHDIFSKMLEESNIRIRYTVSRTDLEQTFLSYAIHQISNEPKA